MASPCDLGNAADALHLANPRPLPRMSATRLEAPPAHRTPPASGPSSTAPPSADHALPLEPRPRRSRSPDPARGLRTFVRRAPLRLVLLVLLAHGCGRSGSAEERLPVARSAPVGSGPFASAEHFRVTGRCSARGRFEARWGGAARATEVAQTRAQPRCTVPRLRGLLRGASLGPRSLGSRRRRHGRGGGRPEASASLCRRAARGSRGDPAASQ